MTDEGNADRARPEPRGPRDTKPRHEPSATTAKSSKFSQEERQEPASSGSSAHRPPGGETSKPAVEKGDTGGLKEIVTSIIAILIVVVTMWVLTLAFLAAGDEFAISQDDVQNADLLDKRIQIHEQAQANRKDILTVGVGLLSVILGFYFGRVPAERRAERAEQEATKAHSSVNQAIAGARDAEHQARSAEDQANNATHARERAEAKVQDAKATLSRMKGSLTTGAEQRRKTLAAAGTPITPTEVDHALDDLSALLERLQ